jgi:hypothetical protein
MSVKFEGRDYDIDQGRFQSIHIPKAKEDDIWKRDFYQEIFNIENKKIEEWIKNVGPQKNKNEIETMLKQFTEFLSGEKDKILKSFDKNEYWHMYQEGKESNKYLIFLILSIIGETAILIVQSLAGGGFNPVILIFAFLLALGGLGIGFFCGQIFRKKEAEQKGIYNPREDNLLLKHWLALILGVVLTLFVAYVRGVTEEGFDIQVFILTILLALVVAFFEALLKNYLDKREFAMYEQIEALKIYASYKHEELLDSGYYKRIFFH